MASATRRPTKSYHDFSPSARMDADFLREVVAIPMAGTSMSSNALLAMVRSWKAGVEA